MAKKPDNSEAGKLPFPPPYQKKVPYFAHKLIRLMTKKVAALKIGSEGAYLVAVVAMQEDAAGYEGPVLFDWPILASLIGVKTWDTLNRFRDRACEAGWLVYVPPPKGSDHPGEYWTRIPDGLTLEDDGYIGEPIRSEEVIKNEAIAQFLGGLKSGQLCISENSDGSLTIRENADGSRMDLGCSSDGSRIALYIDLLPITVKKSAASPSPPSVASTKATSPAKDSRKPSVRHATLDDLTCGLVVPDSLNVPVFNDAWRDWVAYRIERKERLTETAIKVQLKHLAILGPQQAAQMIAVTIGSTWTGLRDADGNTLGSLATKGHINGKSGPGTTRAGGSRGTIQAGAGTIYDSTSPTGGLGRM